MNIHDITKISFMSTFIVICAWINIKLPFVSFTMQTLGVFVALETLGGTRGLYSIIIYISLGVIGMPVFSNYQGGVGVLFGMTGGYILGFVFQSIIYIVATKFFGISKKVRILAMVLGLLSCYLFGTIWFVYLYSRNVSEIGILSALMMCVIPFVIPDFVKMYFAFIISNRLNKFFDN